MVNNYDLCQECHALPGADRFEIKQVWHKLPCILTQDCKYSLLCQVRQCLLKVCFNGSVESSLASTWGETVALCESNEHQLCWVAALLNIEGHFPQAMLQIVCKSANFFTA